MINFFNIATTGNQGSVRPPEWLYCDVGLKRSLATVVKYYRKNPMAVDSDHFLVKILQSITVPQSLNLYRYYDNVSNMALGLSMTLKMSSYIFKGEAFDGVFYGKGCTEFLIADTDSFDPEQIDKDWTNARPVTVLRHPISDLGFNLPNGEVNSTDKGIAVIAINIPMLAIQYRAFRNNENLVAVDSQRSIYQFIHMYVLPNMMYSHIDYVMFNRLRNIEYGIPMGESKAKHPFYLTSYEDKLVHVDNFIINNIRDHDKDFVNALTAIPMVASENGITLIEVPDVAPTRQILPVMLISKIDVLAFINRVSSNKRNQVIFSQLTKYINNLNILQMAKQYLTEDEFIDLSDTVDSLFNKQ